MNKVHHLKKSLEKCLPHSLCCHLRMLCMPISIFQQSIHFCFVIPWFVSNLFGGMRALLEIWPIRSSPTSRAGPDQPKCAWIGFRQQKHLNARNQNAIHQMAILLLTSACMVKCGMTMHWQCMQYVCYFIYRLERYVYNIYYIVVWWMLYELDCMLDSTWSCNVEKDAEWFAI